MSTNRLQTIDLTTWTTCMDHINMLQRIQQRGLYCTAEAYIHSECSLTNDELSSMAARDENHQKVVPRSNCSLRHALLSTTVFRRLTLFSIKSSRTPIRFTFFPFCGYELANSNWSKCLMTNMVDRLRNVIIGCKESQLGKTDYVVNLRMRQLLFCLEFVINDGACLIYKGNCSPSRSAKGSLIKREMQTSTVKNLWASTETTTCYFTNGLPELTYGKSKVLSCVLEHDRMLYNGCDRQHHSLVDNQVDEFKFLTSCEDIGWKPFPDLNDCLMIGGLWSPCMNSCFGEDGMDRTGRCLRLF